MLLNFAKLLVSRRWRLRMLNLEMLKCIYLCDVFNSSQLHSRQVTIAAKDRHLYQVDLRVLLHPTESTVIYHALWQIHGGHQMTQSCLQQLQ